MLPFLHSGMRFLFFSKDDGFFFTLTLRLLSTLGYCVFCRAPAKNCPLLRTWAIAFLRIIFHLLKCSWLCFSRNYLKFVEFFLFSSCRIPTLPVLGLLPLSSQSQDFYSPEVSCEGEHLAGIWKIQMQLSFLGRGLLSFLQLKKIGADTYTERSASTRQTLSPSFPMLGKPEHHKCLSLSSEWNHQVCGPLPEWELSYLPSSRLGAVISSHECHQ